MHAYKHIYIHMYTYIHTYTSMVIIEAMTQMCVHIQICLIIPMVASKFSK